MDMTLVPMEGESSGGREIAVRGFPYRIRHRQELYSSAGSCEFQQMNDRIWVRNLGVPSGVALNGVQLRDRANLRDGDSLALGSYVFRVRLCRSSSPQGFWLDTEFSDPANEQSSGEFLGIGEGI